MHEINFAPLCDQNDYSKKTKLKTRGSRFKTSTFSKALSRKVSFGQQIKRNPKEISGRRRIEVGIG
ncbi:hypothetical protein T08_11857 [Trichinella sp. T8]|nr:hypothetical protein T08_11857 [Trichinella sp. T8]